MLAHAIDAARHRRPQNVPGLGVLQHVADELSPLRCALLAGLAIGDARALLTVAQALQAHLFLNASRLLPLWRDRCRRPDAVDLAEVQLAQSRALVDQLLARGEADPLLLARCAVLADELQRLAPVSQGMLMALGGTLDGSAQRDLAAEWRSETRRLQRSWQAGERPILDNEDADPVGQPPR